MAVQSIRVGVPIAYGSQRFYAEKEGLGKRSRRQFSDRSPSDHVERREAKVDEDVHPENQAGKPWPAKGQDQLVNIVPVVLRGVDFDKLAVFDSERDWGRRSFHEVALFEHPVPWAKSSFMNYLAQKNFSFEIIRLARRVRRLFHEVDRYFESV